MVAAAAGRDRGLLQRPQPRRRLAGVEDLGAGAGHRLDVARGQRRDAGEVAEEVERGALGGQQRRRRPAGEQHLGRHLLAPLALDHELVDVLDPALAHRLRDQVEPEDDARPAFCTIRARARRLGGHGRLRGHVAVAEVLGQRRRDDLAQRLSGLGHRASLDQRRAMHLATPEMAKCIARHLTSGPAAAFNPRGDRAAPVPDPDRRARRRRDGGLRGAVGRGDAEDCFQETFLAALRAYPKLRDGGNLRGWLLTIAHRKAIDHHRARGRRPVPVAEVARGRGHRPRARRRRGLGSGRRRCRRSSGPR